MLKGLFKLQLPGSANQEKKQAEYRKHLIRQMAKIGGQLFGPIPEGHRREFFCLDKHTWVWHEEWNDATGKRQIMTTRYDVRPNSVLKSQGSKHYQSLTSEELRNLHKAMVLYQEQMNLVLPQIASDGSR